MRGIERVGDQLRDGRVEGQPDMTDRIERADVLDERVFVDANPTKPDQIEDMTTYYIVVRRGLTT